MEIVNGIRFSDLDNADFDSLACSTVCMKLQDMARKMSEDILKRDPWLKDQGMDIEDARMFTAQGELLLHDKTKGSGAGYIRCPPSDISKLEEIQRAYLTVYTSKPFTRSRAESIMAELRQGFPNDTFHWETTSERSGTGLVIYDQNNVVRASGFGSTPGTTE